MTKFEIEEYYESDIRKTCYRLSYRGFCLNMLPLLGGHISTLHLQSAMRKLERAYEESMKAQEFKTPYRCQGNRGTAIGSFWEDILGKR
jgi:uncharacterized protein YktA (UPF0223 family)